MPPFSQIAGEIGYKKAFLELVVFSQIIHSLVVQVNLCF